MKSANSFTIGQQVIVTFAWRETELPTDDNFHYGQITEVIEKSVYAVYVRVEGLTNPVPIDRVCAVENTNEENKKSNAALVVGAVK